MITTDVLVIGSGLAGLCAAIEAASKGVNVVLATKSSLGYASSTLYTSRGFRVSGPEYTMERHFIETIVAGKLINDQELVRTMVKEAPRRIMELKSYGVKIVRGRKFASVKGWRPVAGLSIVKPLVEVVKRLRVRTLEGVMAIDLLVDGGKVEGAAFYSLKEDTVLSVCSSAVVLATGGYSQLYIRSDNPSRVSGDGCALALRAGAKLVDMEFVQFYPLGLAEEGGPAWLFPAVKGRLINAKGEDVLAKYGISLPLNVAAINMRDLLSRIMWTEISKAEGATPLLVEFEVQDESEMKSVIDDLGYLARLIDLKSKKVKVAPLAHFTMGGVVINPDCSTGVEGLYACGEVAGGVHGANRLGGNALTEAAVFGTIAGRSAAEYASSRGLHSKSPPDIGNYQRLLRSLRSGGKHAVQNLKRNLKTLMWECCGIIRSRSSLERLIGEVDELRTLLEDVRVTGRLETLEALELQNMVSVAEAVARAALMREESRGAHYREDYPVQDDRRWLRRICVKLHGDSLELEAEPVKLKYIGTS